MRMGQIGSMTRTFTSGSYTSGFVLNRWETVKCVYITSQGIYWPSDVQRIVVWVVLKARCSNWSLLYLHNSLLPQKYSDPSIIVYLTLQ